MLYGPTPLSAYEYAEWCHIFKMEHEAAEKAKKERTR